MGSETILNGYASWVYMEDPRAANAIPCILVEPRQQAHRILPQR